MVIAAIIVVLLSVQSSAQVRIEEGGSLNGTIRVIWHAQKLVAGENLKKGAVASIGKDGSVYRSGKTKIGYVMEDAKKETNVMVFVRGEIKVYVRSPKKMNGIAQEE